MQSEKEILPSCVCDNEDALLIARDLRKIVNSARSAYQRLLESSKDFGAIPPPEELTHEWIDKIIKERKKAIEDSPLLTEENKKKLLKIWGDISRDSRRDVGFVLAFYREFPPENVGYDKNLHVLYVKDVDGIARDRATQEVPSLAHQHWEHVKEAKSAINKLRTWEREMGIKKVRLENLFNMTAEAFASVWVKSGFKYDDQLLTQRDIYIRENFENLFL